MVYEGSIHVILEIVNTVELSLQCSLWTESQVNFCEDWNITIRSA